MRAALLVLAVALLAPPLFEARAALDSGPAPAPDSGSAAAAEPAPARPKGPPPPPVVEVHPPDGPWTLGVLQDLVVEIEHDPRLDLHFPGRPATPGFSLEELRRRVEHLPNGRVKRRITLRLVPLRLDAVRLPRIEVVWNDREDPEVRGAVPVDLGRVIVRGQFEGPEEARLGADPAGLPLIVRRTALLVALIALAAALAGALLTYLLVRWLRRRMLARQEPEIPPELEARRALDALRADEALLAQHPILWFTRLSEILRRFLGRRYRFDALEATTTELIAWVEARRPAALSVLELRELLGTMDLVKFAGQLPGSGQAAAALDAVRALVDRAAESEEERAARKLRAEALVPQRTERLYGLIIDACAAGLVAAPFFVAGRNAAELLWIASGGGVLALAFLLRDLAGRSLGKVVAGLRLQDSRRADFEAPDAQEPPEPGALILRNALLALLVGVVAEAVALWVLPDRRRLGDLLAHTRVLRTRPGGRHPSPGVLTGLGILAAALCVALPLWAVASLGRGAP